MRGSQWILIFVYGMAYVGRTNVYRNQRGRRRFTYTLDLSYRQAFCLLFFGAILIGFVNAAVDHVWEVWRS